MTSMELMGVAWGFFPILNWLSCILSCRFLMVPSFFLISARYCFSLFSKAYFSLPCSEETLPSFFLWSSKRALASLRSVL